MANYYTHASFTVLMPVLSALEFMLDMAIMEVLAESDVINNSDPKAELQAVLLDDDGPNRLIIDCQHRLRAGLASLEALLPENQALADPAPETIEARIREIATDTFSDVHELPNVTPQKLDDDGMVHMWFCHDETFPSESTAQLIRRFLVRDKLDTIVTFETSYTCSKARIDAYGGAAWAVSRLDVRSTATEFEARDMADKLEAQLKHEAAGQAKCPNCEARGGVRRIVAAHYVVDIPSVGAVVHNDLTSDYNTFDDQRYECAECSEELDEQDLEEANPELKL